MGDSPHTPQPPEEPPHARGPSHPSVPPPPPIPPPVPPAPEPSSSGGSAQPPPGPPPPWAPPPPPPAWPPPPPHWLPNNSDAAVTGPFLLMLGGLLAFVSTWMPWANGLSLWDLDTLERLFSDPDAGPFYSVNTAATSLVLCGVLCMLCGVVGLVARLPEAVRRCRRVSGYATAGLLLVCIGTLVVAREALDDPGPGLIAMILATVLGLYGRITFDRGGRGH